MDFLKNLSLNDDKDKNEPQASVPPRFERAKEEQGFLQSLGIGGKEDEDLVPSVPPATTDAETERRGISSFFSGSRNEEAPPAVSVVNSNAATTVDTEKPHHHSLSSIFGNDKEPVPTVTASNPDKEESLLDKIGNHFSPKTEAEAPVPKKEDESFIDRISSQFGGNKTPPPAPPSPKPIHEQLLEKIGVHSQTGTAVVPPAEQSLSDKILHFRDSEPDKVEDAGFKNKVSSFLGAKTEKEEDHLDKAIDLFQEHVLKEGDQKNESTIERLKDDQIADAIRRATGWKGDDDDEK